MPKIFGVTSNKTLEQIKEESVDNAHDTLNYIMRRGSENGNSTVPAALILELSHILSHILLASPKKEYIFQAFKMFMEDLDLKNLLVCWERFEAEEQEEGVEKEECSDHNTLH